MKTHRSIWIVVAVVIAATLLLVRIQRVREKENAPPVPKVPVAVETAPVTRGTVVHSRHVLGTVVGADEASVAPRVMGQVIEVRVREGDTVRRGDVVAVLDARELEDALTQAEAGLQAAREGLTAAETADAAERDSLARDERLFEARAVSEEQWERSQVAAAASSARLEAARAQVEIAHKRLDQARTRLTYCRMTAPLTGVVGRRLADPGDLAVPGKPLLEIVRQDRVRVRAQVPPEDLPDLAVGQKVTLSLDGAQVDAAISRVFPAMDASHLAAFEADLSRPPAGFVSGATVGVDLHLGSAEGLTVPAGALLEGDSATWVFKVADATVRAVPVQIEARSPERAVIVGDLSPGARVVVARPSRLMTLADGVAVQPAEPAR
jgi:RND family efflux transporter MFP subunit